jgi:ParB/RepB/Spo0J family partition protein
VLTTTFQNLARTLLRAPDDPSRLAIDPAKVGELADDMASNGLLQPLGVRGPMPDGTYEIGYGHRRYLAAGLLGWSNLECKVFPPATDLHQIRVSENHQREPLTPMEEAHEIAAFIERGEPLAMIARRYRKSAGWVEQRRALLHFPADIQDAIHAGAVKLAVASVLAQFEHDAYRAEMLREAQRTGATAAVVELWLQHWKVDGHRLQHNLSTVEEIAARRAAFVYYVPCDLCQEPADFALTRAFRTCPTCTTALDELIARTAAEAAGATRAGV